MISLDGNPRVSAEMQEKVKTHIKQNSERYQKLQLDELATKPIIEEKKDLQTVQLGNNRITKFQLPSDENKERLAESKNTGSKVVSYIH